MMNNSARGAGRRPGRAATAVVALALLASVAGLAGCPSTTARQQAARQPASQTARLQSEVRRLTEENRLMRQRGASAAPRATLYFMNQTATDMFLTPVVVTLPSGARQPEAALRALIAGPAAGSPLKPVLPKETKVLGVTTQNWVARANFSADVKRLNVGSRGEALAVAAITNTLTKFPEIERVQILIDGQTVETLAGHIDITKPLGRNDAVVQLPSGTAQGTGTARPPTG